MKAERYSHISDAELLDQYRKNGNTEWMGILLERYTLLLLGVCMKYLKNETEARDAVQQIFLKVLTEAAKYKIDYFKSWLYMVAKNYCLMRLRDKGIRSEAAINENALVHQEPETQALLQNEATYDLLEEALKELATEQQQCVILFYLKKYSYQQIADKTNFSLLQVKSYIQNGKRNLRIIIERKMKERQKK